MLTVDESLVREWISKVIWLLFVTSAVYVNLTESSTLEVSHYWLIRILGFTGIVRGAATKY